jgi:hypothetical protein
MVRGDSHAFAQSHVAMSKQLEQSLVRYSLHKAQSHEYQHKANDRWIFPGSLGCPHLVHKWRPRQPQLPSPYPNTRAMQLLAMPMAC